MTRRERQQSIVKLLEEEDFVSVADLSRKMGTSLMTIRRDLERFEQMGIIRRVHGGAMLQKIESTVPAFVDRYERCNAEKNAIGKAALRFIQPDSIVCFDAGTTTLAVARQIPAETHFTAITTGVRTSLELSKRRLLDIIQVGGSLDHSTLTITNELSTQFLKQFRADVAFLSTRAIDSTRGSFDVNLVREKQDLADISQKVVVLADYTKFINTPVCLALPLNRIDVVITDAKAGEKDLINLRNAGIEVIVANVDEG